MRARGPRGPLGLRGRILGAVLFTTVTPLGVAALALLGPLEQSLRSAEVNTLRGEVGSQKRTSPASFFRTVKPFTRWDPALVAQADIPVPARATGGAPIKA